MAVLTEAQAREKVNNVWAAKELFIVLSESQYHDRVSVPRAFRCSEDMIALSIFTTYKFAENFCRSEKYVIDGRPLVGRIDNTDRLRDLYSIVNLALHLGVTHTDIDCLTDDVMNIRLTALLNWGAKKPQGVSMLMSEEEYKRRTAEGRLGLNFNEMPIYVPK